MWLGRKEIETAIFWDYENVPIPANNGDKFLEGLKNLIQVSTVELARVYYRKETMHLPQHLDSVADLCEDIVV